VKLAAFKGNVKSNSIVKTNFNLNANPKPTSSQPKAQLNLLLTVQNVSRKFARKTRKASS